MSTTLAIAQSIQTTLVDFVNAQTFLTADAPKGTSTLQVQRTDRFKVGETLALCDAQSRAELIKVACTDSSTLTLCEPTQGIYNASTAFVQRTYGGKTVESIIIGNPEALSSYPAITIQADEMESIPFTLRTVSETYNFNVSCWSNETKHNQAYAGLLTLTDAARLALFRRLYPVIAPYVETTLVEPTTNTDTLIRVKDATRLKLSWLVVDDASGTRRIVYATAIDGSTGVVTLSYGIGASFVKGTSVIAPLAQTYDPRVHRVSYDDSLDNDTLLKSSTLHYSIKLARYV